MRLLFVGVECLISLLGHLCFFVVSYDMRSVKIQLIQKRLLWALAVGHWEAIVWRSLNQSIALFSYAQTIAQKLGINFPIINMDM